LDPARLAGIPDAVEAVGGSGLTFGPALFIVQRRIVTEALLLEALLGRASPAGGVADVAVVRWQLCLGSEAGGAIEASVRDLASGERDPSGERVALLGQELLGIAEQFGEAPGDDACGGVALDLPLSAVAVHAGVGTRRAQRQQCAQSPLLITQTEVDGRADGALDVMEGQELPGFTRGHLLEAERTSHDTGGVDVVEVA